jgi:hypothetical protein
MAVINAVGQAGCNQVERMCVVSTIEGLNVQRISNENVGALLSERGATGASRHGMQLLIVRKVGVSDAVMCAHKYLLGQRQSSRGLLSSCTLMQRGGIPK